MTDTQPAGTPAPDQDRCGSTMSLAFPGKQAPTRYQCSRPDGHGGLHASGAGGYTWGTPEPSTPPATPAGERPAGPDPHPGTPGGPGDGTGVLGRALIGEYGELSWIDPHPWIRAQEGGHVGEVLLVDPAAGRVLDAARFWLAVRKDRDYHPSPAYADACAALAAAVDAAGGDQPGEPAPEPEDSHSLTDHARLPTGPAPEPDSGPGWEQRDLPGPACPHHADLRACAELAEVTAQRNNLMTQTRNFLRQIDNLADEASAHEGELGDMRAQLSAAEAETDRLRAELDTARRDAAAELHPLLGDLLDPDPCRFDHLGHCQRHGWMSVEPRCPHSRARELLVTAEVRAGSRTVPGSPQPAGEGGGDSSRSPGTQSAEGTQTHTGGTP